MDRRSIRKLADYRGRVVVIEFWGIWCGPCIRMIPAIKELQNQYEGENVVFLGIHSAGTSDEEVKSQLSKHNWTIPSAIDDGTSLADSMSANAFGVVGYPTIVIIDRFGKVSYHSGRAERQAFVNRIERLAED
ncbi:MAG: TlpA disulfide reductase family protein [Pirellulaceae bacterium]